MSLKFNPFTGTFDYVKSKIKALFVTYDNTSSGLTAIDVQTAIDEIAQNGSGSVDTNLDGGFPDSVYTSEQCFDGGVI